MIVTIYSEFKDCLWSNYAKQLLDYYEIEYEQYFPFPELRQHMAWEYGYTYFPHIWINDQFIGGYADLEYLLH
jgi:glutaredoxin